MNPTREAATIVHPTSVSAIGAGGSGLFMPPDPGESFVARCVRTHAGPVRALLAVLLLVLLPATDARAQAWWNASWGWRVPVDLT